MKHNEEINLSKAHEALFPIKDSISVITSILQLGSGFNNGDEVVRQIMNIRQDLFGFYKEFMDTIESSEEDIFCLILSIWSWAYTFSSKNKFLLNQIELRDKEIEKLHSANEILAEKQI